MGLSTQPGLNNLSIGASLRSSSSNNRSITNAIRADSNDSTEQNRTSADFVLSENQGAEARTFSSSASFENARFSQIIRAHDLRGNFLAKGSSTTSGSPSFSSESPLGTTIGKSLDNTASTKSFAGSNDKTPDLPSLPKKTTDQTDALVPNPDNVPLTQSEFDVIRYTNALRQLAGKEPLIVKQNLMDTAQLSSDRMKNQNNMVHGLTSGWRGENIAMGQNSAQEVANAWKNSAGHYANMMGNFKYIGVGDTTERNGSNYWTQQFG